LHTWYFFNIPEIFMKQKDTPAYHTGKGSYNRDSGKKTLYFVGVLISLITVLALLSFYLLFQKG